MTQRLESLLSVLKGHRIFIQTHNFPDPDAIASAYGVQRLLEHFDIKAVIIYSGTVAKTSTAKMLDMIGIEMTDIQQISDLSEKDAIITVDSQTNNSNIAKIDGTVVACIDHHPTVVHYDYKFRDVRICGSCSTLVAGYFFENDLPVDKSTATALMYGLRMDTEDLKRGMTEQDVEIFAKLFPLADHEKLKTLARQQMDFADLKAYTMALSNIKVFGDIGFSFIDSEASDGLIASVCDFMLTLVEVQFAIAYSYRGNGLKFSVRSSIEYLDAGTITTNALEGIGTGGGHSTMAGGYLPFESIEDAEFDLEEEIQNRFINAVYFCRELQNVLTDPLIKFIENTPEHAEDIPFESVQAVNN